MRTEITIWATVTACGAVAGYALRYFLTSRATAIAVRWFHDTTAASNGHEAATFDRMRPLVEKQVDEFLSIRLPREMPMIGMFIGEKTIAQLKAIFLKELEDIFPLVMQQYLVAATGLPLTTPSTLPSILPLIRKLLRHELRYAPLIGAATGSLVGFLQLLFGALIR